MPRQVAVRLYNIPWEMTQDCKQSMQMPNFVAICLLLLAPSGVIACPYGGACTDKQTAIESSMCKLWSSQVWQPLFFCPLMMAGLPAACMSPFQAWLSMQVTAIKPLVD